jgi:Holliday junction resolvase RusA-like endonuclease
MSPEAAKQLEENLKAAKAKGSKLPKPSPFLTPEQFGGGLAVLKKLADEVCGNGDLKPVVVGTLKEPVFMRVTVPQPKESKFFSIPVTPIGAPRMTRRDKWLKPRRPCVQAYFDYRAILQKATGDIPTVPDRVELKAFVPMPPSWSKKKKEVMAGKPHRQKPDLDNICKGIFDSLFIEDGGVWSGEQFKYWCREGEQRVELKLIWY